MTEYRPRELAKSLVEALADIPVVVLSGMRQTGKSTLLLNEAVLKNRRYVSLDDFNTLEAARRNPENLLAGERPITIDEAQRYPELLRIVKRAVDRDRKAGQFILSGSANFLLLKSVAESLAGRAVYLTLCPFTRREIHGSTREVPALIHFINKGVFPERKVPPVTWSEVMKGGMPSVCLGEVKNPGIWFRGFEQTYLERDVRALSQVADLVSFRHVLQLVAFRNGQVLKQSELARDARLNVMTTSRYLSLMEISFITHRMAPHLGNRASRLIKSPKLYLSDSGLAAYLAGVRHLTLNEPMRGALFECFVAQNLVAILSAHDPETRMTYWHVQGRYEVDFVIEIGNETLAVEVKNGSRWQERDLRGLKAFLDSSRKCRAALLAYTGDEVVKLENRLWVVPVHLLLS